MRAVNKAILAALGLLTLIAFVAARRTASPVHPTPPPKAAAVPSSPPASSPPAIAIVAETPTRSGNPSSASGPDAVFNQAETTGDTVLETTAEADPFGSQDPEQSRREWRDWAAKDFEAALAAALELPEGDERDAALADVCLGRAQHDPADAVKTAQKLQQPEAVMETLIQQWSANDLVSALLWAGDQPTGDQRDQFLQRIAFVLSQSDPSDAASLVTEQIPPGPIQDEAVMTVLHQWANQNLIAAAGWVDAFPFRTSQLQERALDELENLIRFQLSPGE